MGYHYRSVRFTALLVALLLVMFVRIVTMGHLAGESRLDLLGAVVLLAATISLCEDQRFRLGALLLGIPAITMTVLSRLMAPSEIHISFVLSRVFSVIFLAFTIGIILRSLLTQHEVTRDSIVGAFCGYALLGVIWAEMYCLTETFVPGSFRVTAFAGDPVIDPARRWLVLEYFSFITLSTLGYGDVIPCSPIARCLALWEALCGQFYLAVLVASLVSVRVTHTTSTRRVPQREDFT